MVNIPIQAQTSQFGIFLADSYSLVIDELE